jgi:lysophospholipase L1-like esterase
MDRSTPNSTSTAAKLPTVVLFGDSLTAWSFGATHGKGFGDVLTREFAGRAEVLNEGLFSSFNI